MADDSKDRRFGGQAKGAPSANAGTKRPYATLDLKATEIKITPVTETTKSSATAAARGNAMPDPNSIDITIASVPTPAPASDYAERTKPDAIAATAASRASASAPEASAAARPHTEKANAQPQAAANTSRGGGVFSHLAAGITGGALAIAGLIWGLPQLGINLRNAPLSDDTAAIGQRLQALERRPNAETATNVRIDERLAAVEKSVARIPALLESQTRLVADTKAALAAKADDSGMPEMLTRLSTVEQKFKALQEAGATDSEAGRIEQIAALTGKVTDLENKLSADVATLKKNVAEDVAARVEAVAASQEAAKTGNERVDKDLAAIKSEAALLTERMAALKAENDKLASVVKTADESTASVKSQMQQLQASLAKPADITATVEPLTTKITSLESTVEKLLQAEKQRSAESDRVILSLELQNLKRAIANGRDYAPELQAIKKTADGKFDLAALERFKDQGVPSQADLVVAFRNTANATVDADAKPAEGGVVDRLLAGAKSIVRVRKINYPDDDKSVEAVVGRMETALKDGRLTDALSDAEQLTPKAREAAAPFLDRLAARVSVDEAVANIENQLKAPAGAAIPAP